MKARMPGTNGSGRAAGDNGVIETLSRRYRAVLLRYFVRRGIAVPDAQDLAQDVFARLSRRDTLADVEAMEGYIFAMAANALIDHSRRSKVRADGAAALQSVGGKEQDFSPERLLAGRQELAAIIDALNEMPERMRNILILARLENMSRQEIAQRLGISKSLVDQQITHAMACLADRRRRLS